MMVAEYSAAELITVQFISCTNNLPDISGHC